MRRTSGRAILLALAALMLFGSALAESGDSSPYARGMRYWNGDGVPSNHALAVELFEKAAEQGDAEAQYALANVYLEGVVVDANPGKAITWLVNAAAQGHLEAQIELAGMYAEGRNVDRSADFAAKWYESAAAQGDSRGWVGLGELRAESGNWEQAVDMYRRAAEMGDAEGQARMGDAYFDGLGVEQDEDQALAWYRLAAEQDSARGTLGMAKCYARMRWDYSAWRPDTVNNLYLRAAALGNAEAQRYVASYYMNRSSDDSDVDEAIDWLYCAAGQGDTSAMLRLASLIESDESDSYGYDGAERAAAWRALAKKPDRELTGVESYEFACACASLVNLYVYGCDDCDPEVGPNPERAVAWLHRTGLHFGSFAYTLSQLYHKGIDDADRSDDETTAWLLKPDDDMAAIWLYRAAELQSPEALRELLSRARYLGGGKALAQLRSLAWKNNAAAQYYLSSYYSKYSNALPRKYTPIEFFWVTCSAEAGYPRAMMELAVFYQRSGLLCPYYPEAIKWFERAAQAGYSADSAWYQIGSMYREGGHGIEQDYDEALSYYIKASDAGSCYAQCAIGDLYAQGLSVEQSDEKAASWYLLAAENGSSEASLKLARMYETGTGVPQNAQKALNYYADSAMGGNSDALTSLESAARQGNAGAREQLERVAEEGYSSIRTAAQYMLGRMYEDGAGVGRDLQAAVQWYSLAADNGSEEAQKRLDAMRATGAND